MAASQRTGMLWMDFLSMSRCFMLVRTSLTWTISPIILWAALRAVRLGSNSPVMSSVRRISWICWCKEGVMLTESCSMLYTMEVLEMLSSSPRACLLQNRNKKVIRTRKRKEAPLMKASTTMTLLWSVEMSGKLMTTLFAVTLSVPGRVLPLPPWRSSEMTVTANREGGDTTNNSRVGHDLI